MNCPIVTKPLILSPIITSHRSPVQITRYNVSYLPPLIPWRTLRKLLSPTIQGKRKTKSTKIRNKEISNF